MIRPCTLTKWYINTRRADCKCENWHSGGGRGEFVTARAAGGIGIFPLDGSGIGGVGVAGAAEFADWLLCDMPRNMP